MKAIINGETIELGSSGVTFTPSVSPEGELSWSNDGGLDNPEPVNIKGPTGEPGNTPFIGENGNWWVGETDTGVAASGGNDDSGVEGAIPVKPLTLEEYISLSDEEKSSETLWLITDVSDEVYPRTLDEASWNDIQKWSKSGALKANYSVGDKKTITIGGTFNGVTVPSTEIELVIAGFDHNQELETPGEHCTHFLLGWKDAHFIFMAGIAMYGSGQTNAGGWRDSLARSVLQNPTIGLKAILPPDLMRVMRSVKKYTNNVAGTGSVANQANITATDDDIAILSVFEALGITGTADVNEKDFQKRYALLSDDYTVNLLSASSSIGSNSQSFQWFRSPTLGRPSQYELFLYPAKNETNGTAYVEAAAGILLFV